MEEYLSISFLPQAKLGKDLALGFINDWRSLEPKSESATKENIWKKCLDFVSERSRVLSRVFNKNFEILEYTEDTLVIRSKRESIKDVFESKFKDEIVLYLRDEIPDFKIEVVNSQQAIFPALTTLKAGTGFQFYAKGSYFIETRINPSQEFDNFIVSSFNAEAYSFALNLIQAPLPFFVIIRGAAGTGKTHLTHSIANYISEYQVGTKVIVFNVLPALSKRGQLDEFNIDELETIASDNDVIMIDDLQNINIDQSSIQALVRILKLWREMNKSIILSYRDPFQIDIPIEISANSQQLVLMPPNESDRVKLIESKIKDYGIHLTRNDFLQLSGDQELRNISDIQKKLIRLYLTERLKSRSRNIFISHSPKEYLKPDLVNTCVGRYFKLNKKNSFIEYSNKTSLNARIVSSFIQDIFSVSQPGRRSHPEITSSGQTFYFFDSLQYHLFENKEFREIILAILWELLSRKDKEE